MSIYNFTHLLPNQHIRTGPSIEVTSTKVSIVVKQVCPFPKAKGHHSNRVSHSNSLSFERLHLQNHFHGYSIYYYSVLINILT